MNIKETNFKFNGVLSPRTRTSYIVLHHRAGNGDAESIHKQHLNQGYVGIGYHYYIRKNGNIYTGRPLNKMGAHVKGYNSVSVGVCFEGNFENEKPTKEQIKSGNQLIKYLLNLYPRAKVIGHNDLMSTACPGKNFSVNQILSYSEVKTMEELTSINDIVWELANRGIITDKQLWLKKLGTDTNAYWLARKCINYIRGLGV